jgi:hypothetical protein
MWASNVKREYGVCSFQKSPAKTLPLLSPICISFKTTSVICRCCIPFHKPNKKGVRRWWTSLFLKPNTLIVIWSAVGEAWTLHCCIHWYVHYVEFFQYVPCNVEIILICIHSLSNMSTWIYYVRVMVINPLSCVLWSWSIYATFLCQ